MDLRETLNNSLRSIFHTSMAARRAELRAYVAGQTGNIVQAGPFAGMVLTGDTSWDPEGDETSKLLGFYEEEIHTHLEQAIASQPDLVLNVGCAEGYYAVGLARRLPQSRTIAFDIDPNAQNVCRKTAVINYVAARMSVAGAASAADLETFLCDAQSPFIFMDCEGAEMELLDPEVAPSLCRTRILVELHDFANRAITPILKARFEETHHLEFIPEGPRDPNRSPLLAQLNSMDRWIAICENRPEQMFWLDAVPRT